MIEKRICLSDLDFNAKYVGSKILHSIHLKPDYLDSNFKLIKYLIFTLGLINTNAIH